MQRSSQPPADGQAPLDHGALRRVGREHARGGLPLPDLIAMVYGGGAAHSHSMLLQHRAGRMPRDLLGEASEVVFDLAGAVCTAVVEGYVEGLGSVDTDLVARRQVLVGQLLGAEPLDLAEVRASARDVGWELPPRLAVAVVSPDSDVSADTSWPPDVLVARHEGRWCLLLPADEADRVDPPVPDGIAMAVGPTVACTQARQSLRVADDLLRLASQGIVAPRQVLRVEEHGVEAMVVRDPHVSEHLVRAHLGPLLELAPQRRGALTETVAAWVAMPGHYTAIAELLGVSVRTVRYRMDRLRELLGGLVDDPGRRLQLAVAVHALRSLDLRGTGATPDEMVRDGPTIGAGKSFQKSRPARRSHD